MTIEAGSGSATDADPTAATEAINAGPGTGSMTTAEAPDPQEELMTAEAPTATVAPVSGGAPALLDKIIAAAAPELLEKWSRISLCVEPVDRAAAEAAVAELYILAGFAPPQHFVWCASPLEGARLITGASAEEAGRFGESLRQELRNGPWQRARADVLTQLGAQGWTQAWRETCGPLMPSATRLVETITTGIGDAAEDEAERSRMLLALTFADHGQHDASWLPLFEAYRAAVAAEETIASEAPAATADAVSADAAILHALAHVAEQLHWWWPFADAAILCERPTTVHLDEQGRAHNGEGAALAYGDGFALYRWHGVTIAEDFAQTLATLTPQIIQGERNAEVRRIMLEHYGHERYIVDSGAKPMQEDEAGRLWQVFIEGDEPISMVEVVNSTAEPDGTFRTYWLRVPPHMRTAKAAVAWTFGLTEEEYQPQIQT
ncbi:DUF6745 domain-containing protein [Actinospica robiniae]|uniref:DUF6745 domain-containing protein n=1 Tax=Actinospica robiniae TaxID=304901 RepID=UPI001B7F85C3|nr:hypothetical protein [Actinospica robiniae]